LITARFAVEQGREVFAMPGSIHSPFSKGCHDLIRSGAKLVDSVDDILSELSGHSLLSEAAMSQARNTVAPRQPRCGEDPLLRAMGDAPVDAQTLSHRLGASIAATQAGLLSLELRGAVVALPGALYQRIR
jgi:DNA processing protein